MLMTPSKVFLPVKTCWKVLLVVLLVVLPMVWLLEQVLPVLLLELSGKCFVLWCLLMALAMALGKSWDCWEMLDFLLLRPRGLVGRVQRHT